jgi:hypothetical protein
MKAQSAPASTIDNQNRPRGRFQKAAPSRFIAHFTIDAFDRVSAQSKQICPGENFSHSLERIPPHVGLSDPCNQAERARPTVT